MERTGLSFDEAQKRDGIIASGLPRGSSNAISEDEASRDQCGVAGMTVAGCWLLVAGCWLQGHVRKWAVVLGNVTFDDGMNRWAGDRQSLKRRSTNMSLAVAWATRCSTIPSALAVVSCLSNAMFEDGLFPRGR